jgi:peptidoglycan/xylan/chitin deacetylase (PgdA/CDA1 family)
VRRGALVLLAAVLLVAFLVACGGSDKSAPAASQGPATSARQPSAKRPAPMPGAHLAAHESVPILMYHVINTPPPGTPLPELWVSREDLNAQMDWLASKGYHGVTLQEVWDAWHKGGKLPSKPVVISFDDGYHSHLTNALPVLRAHGWPGVLNLQVNQTGLDLKPDAVRTLIRAGWEIDSHTFSHPDLTTVDDAQLHHEVADARVALQRQFGVPVNFFCYPAGRYDDRVVAALRAAGYQAATTVELGLASPTDPPFALKRVRVNGSDGVDGLAKDMASAGANT